MRVKLLTSTLALVMISAAVVSTATVQAQSLQTELQSELEASFGKLIDLAQAVPADKYGWRPAEGVRSFGEVFVHVASAAYFFGNMGGVGMPEGLNLEGAEQRITSKDEIVAMLEQARDHVASGISGLSDEALGSEVEWFDGSARSARRVLLVLAEHTSEHIGQLIAYSRMNDITPPWSEG